MYTLCQSSPSPVSLKGVKIIILFYQMLHFCLDLSFFYKTGGHSRAKQAVMSPNVSYYSIFLDSKCTHTVYWKSPAPLCYLMWNKMLVCYRLSAINK